MKFKRSFSFSWLQFFFPYPKSQDWIDGSNTWSYWRHRITDPKIRCINTYLWEGVFKCFRFLLSWWVIKLWWVDFSGWIFLNWWDWVWLLLNSNMRLLISSFFIFAVKFFSFDRSCLRISKVLTLFTNTLNWSVKSCIFWHQIKLFFCFSNFLHNLYFCFLLF